MGSNWDFPNIHPYSLSYIYNMNFMTFPSYWEWNNHPNWRSPSFFRGVGQPPTRYIANRVSQPFDSMDWFSRENLQEKPIFTGKNYGFRLRFSLKPIHWLMVYVLRSRTGRCAQLPRAHCRDPGTWTLGEPRSTKKNGILNQQKWWFNQQKWDFNGISLVKTDKNGDLMRFQCNLMSQNGG